MITYQVLSDHNFMKKSYGAEDAMLFADYFDCGEFSGLIFFHNFILCELRSRKVFFASLKLLITFWSHYSWHLRMITMLIILAAIAINNLSSLQWKLPLFHNWFLTATICHVSLYWILGLWNHWNVMRSETPMPEDD